MGHAVSYVVSTDGETFNEALATRHRASSAELETLRESGSLTSHRLRVTVTQ